MRIAVLGSWPDRPAWPMREDHAAFSAACRRIGRDLAARGHSLIVGSDGEHTADLHAALGALEVYGSEPAAGPARILVVRATDSIEKTNRPAFDTWRRKHPGVFIEYPLAVGSHAVVKLVQTHLADAVILIGGAEHTEQAGTAAALSRKPLACIGSFGGAARAMNQRLHDAPARWGVGSDRAPLLLLGLQEPFGDHVWQQALQLSGIEDAPRLMLVHGRSRDRDKLKKHLLEKVGVRRVVVLADEPATTDTILSKFERLAATVDGAIALVTPDDVGALKADAPQLKGRARENVWLEVGWFWGRRGRSKLLLLTKGEVTIPSDYGGIEHVSYRNMPADCDAALRSFVAQLRAASDPARN